MAKTLPYFRWYPADAETDEKYSGMSDAELGVYHRCLNKAWINGSLPADLDELSKVLRVARKYLDSVWPAVGRCFSENNGRITNKRQEEERAYAVSKSERATSSVRTRYERRSNEPLRAYESVCESDSSSEVLEVVPKKLTLAEAQEWPETAMAIRKDWPATDDRLIMGIVMDSARHYIDVVNGTAGVKPMTDDVLAAAVRAAKTPKQTSAGLYKTSVPRVIRSWAEEVIRDQKRMH